MLAPHTIASVPFLAGNDATFSAIADARRGAAAWPASSVHLYMDSGVGGALLIAGQIVPGARGMAGEFGHMPFGSPSVRCRCGAHGCWNTVLDGPALARHLGESVPGDEVSYSREVLTAARTHWARSDTRCATRRLRWAGGPQPWSTLWIPSWSPSAASPPSCSRSQATVSRTATTMA